MAQPMLLELEAPLKICGKREEDTEFNEQAFDSSGR